MDALYCHPEPTKTCHPNKAHSKIVILSEAEGSEFLRFAALSQDDRMDALYCHPEPTKTCHPNKAHS